LCSIVSPGVGSIKSAKKDDDGSGWTSENSSNEIEVLVRISPGSEYVKCVLHRGRLIGALLLGETGLEETFENLIADQLDLSVLGIDILDPDIDIEDFFD
jgi:hypothetical protein